MKKIKFLLIFTLTTLLWSCGEEKLDPKSIYTNNVERNEFDEWILKNYTTPFNIDFKYRLDDKESQMQYNLAPADYDKSIALAKLIRFLWLDTYEELLGKDFIRTYCPRMIHLIGSPAYNVGTGSIVLGTAEGGLKVTLYNVNSIDIENPDIKELNDRFFHTIHHEFAHILHQTKNYPVEFNLITAGAYTSTDWINVKDADALKLGFVTGYGSSETQEDFVEIISVYITNTKETWDKMMVTAGEKGKPLIDAKLAIVKSWLKSAWGIELDKLRDIVQRRSNEVPTLDLKTLK